MFPPLVNAHEEASARQTITYLVPSPAHHRYCFFTPTSSASSASSASFASTASSASHARFASTCTLRWGQVWSRNYMVTGGICAQVVHDLLPTPLPKRGYPQPWSVDGCPFGVVTLPEVINNLSVRPDFRRTAITT